MKNRFLPQGDQQNCWACFRFFWCILLLLFQASLQVPFPSCNYAPPIQRVLWPPHPEILVVAFLGGKSGRVRQYNDAAMFYFALYFGITLLMIISIRKQFSSPLYVLLASAEQWTEIWKRRNYVCFRGWVQGNWLAHFPEDAGPTLRIESWM